MAMPYRKDSAEWYLSSATIDAMPRTDHDIEQDALSLPANLRLRLARKLLSSVPGSVTPRAADDADLELARKRAAEIDSGQVETKDYRSEMDQIRSFLRQ